MNSCDGPVFRWWFLFSWLGLDAPCVVVTWTWAISQATGLAVEPETLLALFLTVWAIYLSDRMIDVVRCRDWRSVTGRMRFGKRYFVGFAVCLIAAVVADGIILLCGLPAAVVSRAAIVAVGVGCYFLIFVVPVLSREKLRGKEFGVGLFFALGAYGALGYTPDAAWMFVALGLVVAFNCLVIAARDIESDRASDPGGASNWWTTMDRDLRIAGVLLAIVFAIPLGSTPAVPFHLAVVLAFTALTILHHNAGRLSSDAVRALADFCLLTPWLTLGVKWF